MLREHLNRRDYTSFIHNTLFHPLLHDLTNGASHFHGEVCAEFPQICGLTNIFNILHRFAYWQTALTFGEHFIELVFIRSLIFVLEHDELLVKAMSVSLILLLLGRIPKDQ